MRASGTELLKQRRGIVKFILNGSSILFFPATLQHRDVKAQGLSYEDDHRGNAVAGLVMPEHVELRFHSAFSDERIRGIWSRVLVIPEIANAKLGRLYYQGREIL